MESDQRADFQPGPEGKPVALITGAGSGIGQATASLLSRHQTRIAALDQEPARLADTLADIQQAGGEVLPLAANIADPQAIENAVQQIIDQWGRLDIVVANAGINGVWAPIETLSPQEFQHTLEVNLLGTFITLKYSIPYLRRQGGAIVITSSVNGTRIFSNTGATAYACSKGAQIVLMKMLALELARYRIRVNAICPGAIQTAIAESGESRELETARESVEYPEGKIPLTDGVPGSAMQVAQLIRFLVSESSSHITGTEIWIDGGQSLLQG